jgi:hypothetical protein
MTQPNHPKSSCCGAEILAIGGRSFHEFVVYENGTKGENDFVAHYECSKCQQHLAFIGEEHVRFTFALGKNNPKET